MLKGVQCYNPKKTVDEVLNVTRKINLPGSRVLYRWFETGKNAKACLLEPKHWELTGCVADIRFVKKLILSPLQLFSQQVLNEDSEIAMREIMYGVLQRHT